MKVYLSGQITGLPFDECYKKFTAAEELMYGIGLEPVNPLDNGLSNDEPWHEHMIHDIRLLFGCEAIYMLDNWTQSRGARIEHKIAEETNIVILYASGQGEYFEEIKKLNRAIKDATGLCFSEYTRCHRGRYALYARLIYAYKCSLMGMENREIGVILKRDRSTVVYYLKKYHDELKFNPEFREIVENL